MKAKIRILGIAPYENMRPLMLDLAAQYPEIELTVFVGDLQQGVELARRNFYNDYDAIISRGGTATMLRSRLDLPVIEIPILPFDILCAMKLAENVSDHYAIVGFPNITANARALCQMMQYKIDIYSIQDAEEVEQTLLSVRQTGTQAILCDMVAHTTATRLGLEVVLITSGAESIRAAFEEAIRLYCNYQTLREENRFLRGLIWNQINQTVVFNEDGTLFFSTLENNTAPIIDYLREESLRQGQADRQHLVKQIHNVQYSIRRDIELLNGRFYTVYYFSESRVPLADIRRGIRYVNRREAEEQYADSLYGIVGLLRDLQGQFQKLNQTNHPIMVSGEDGTCKEQAVNHLYLQSSRRDRPLAIVDCSMLNERAWSYLMDHHNSPLAQSGYTLFIKNVDILTVERRKQLLANLLAMDVCQRNRLIFSCVCRRGEPVTRAGMEFVEGLGCLTLWLPPTRQRAEQLPAVINVYLSHLNTIQARQFVGLEPEAERLLSNFDWPHNYTQLQRVLKELVLMSEGSYYITTCEVERVLSRERIIGTFDIRVEDQGVPLDLNQSLEEINKAIVRRVLAEENGNQTRTAQRLGIGRTTLWRMLQQQPESTGKNKSVTAGL